MLGLKPFEIKGLGNFYNRGDWQFVVMTLKRLGKKWNGKGANGKIVR